MVKVSIPHWFSLNRVFISLSQHMAGFHPTLVLAQRAHYAPLPRRICVSIPHWFSLNCSLTKDTNSGSYVSIPHWFSLNKISPSLVLLASVVSIPHWFSLNGWGDESSISDVLWFPSHIGSRSTRRIGLELTLASVSIPHWFSLNWVMFLTYIPEHVSFHPTMVLTQLVCPASLKFNWEKFPSHYGSHSTAEFGEMVLQDRSFHPTMVLTQQVSKQ